jgi:hypothetical protein
MTLFLTFILAFAGAVIGSFFGNLLAKTDKHIPVITQVKDAIVTLEPRDKPSENQQRLNAWLYGEKGGNAGGGRY